MTQTHRNHHHKCAHASQIKHSTCHYIDGHRCEFLFPARSNLNRGEYCQINLPIGMEHGCSACGAWTAMPSAGGASCSLQLCSSEHKDHGTIKKQLNPGIVPGFSLNFVSVILASTQEASGTLWFHSCFCFAPSCFHRSQRTQPQRHHQTIIIWQKVRTRDVISPLMVMSWVVLDNSVVEKAWQWNFMAVFMAKFGWQFWPFLPQNPTFSCVVPSNSSELFARMFVWALPFQVFLVPDNWFKGNLLKQTLITNSFSRPGHSRRFCAQVYLD